MSELFYNRVYITVMLVPTVSTVHNLTSKETLASGRHTECHVTRQYMVTKLKGEFYYGITGVRSKSGRLPNLGH